MNVQPDHHALVERVLEGEKPTIDDVDDVILARGSGIGGAPMPSDEAQLEIVLDCFQAIIELEPDEPSHPWNHGAKLKEAERHVEAAALYLRAAELFSIEARTGTGDLGDEADWAQAALWHAVNSLLASRRPLTAALVASRIDDREYRREAEQAVRAEVEA
jgi:hypothetical protein